MTNNEAAERLRWDESNPEWWQAQIEGEREGEILYQWLVNEWAAERRATVERIRERLPEMMKAALPGAFLQADDLALGAKAAGRILDEEAAR